MTFPKDPILGFFYYICVMEKHIGKYTIYSDGKIWTNGIRKKFIKITICKGYPTVVIDGKKATLHRLLALSFIPNPNNLPEINHLNGNKLDFSLSNLVWSSSSENTQHAFNTGLIPKGEKHPNSILTKEQVYRIKYELKHLSKWKLAKMFNCSHTCIYRIKQGITWKDV